MIRRILPFSMLTLALLAVPALGAPPTLPDTPAAAGGLLLARTFDLSEPVTFDWRAERPEYDHGVLLVIEAAPDLLYPRQVAEPVLYVGNQTAMRLNVGYRSGRLVALVPGDVDLASAPIWFGSPELPERVDAETVVAELDAARAAGITPFAPAVVSAAVSAGGDPIRAASLQGVLSVAAELVREHSPSETSRVKSLAGGE